MADIIGVYKSITGSIWFYIIAAAIIAALVLILILEKRRKGRKDVVSSSEELDRFVKKALEDQHIESNIRQVLENKGWEDEVIDTALENAKKKKKSKLFKVIPVPWEIKTEEEQVAEKINNMLSKDKVDHKKLDVLIEEAEEIEEKEEEFLVHPDEKYKPSKSGAQGKAPINAANTANKALGNGEEKTILGADVIKVLIAADHLLEKLPEKELDTFIHSSDFNLYKTVLEQAKAHKLPQKKVISGSTTLKDLMQMSDKGIITKDEAREFMGMSSSKMRKKLADKKIHEKDKALVDSTLKQLEQKEKELEEKERKLVQEEKALHDKETLVEQEERELLEKEKEFSAKEKNAELFAKTTEAEKQVVHHEHITDEMKETLKVIDSLLSKLPHDEIEAFAKSSDYDKYSKIMSEVVGEEPVKPLEAPEPTAAKSNNDKPSDIDMKKLKQQIQDRLRK